MRKKMELTTQVSELLQKKQIVSDKQAKMIADLKSGGLINKPHFTLACGPELVAFKAS
ncbi:hypothetical protein [Plesiomonas shigelloides]|uniref:hypothetical protein n=1 Tax=Plesiomonas shigelloides TaxID=703 RepID=UPI0015A6FAEC|nr:hypothetical protein [Plesiomonas shigelloides]